MQNFSLYILKCCDGSYYVGHTDNIEVRLHQHTNKLFSGYTSIRLPVQLIFLQNFDTRDAAFEAERQIKKWTRKKKEALINGKFNILIQYAKKQF